MTIESFLLEVSLNKMIDNKKILAIIPARSGSKRLKNKNIKPILGKPLIYYTIKEAKKSKYIDEIICSTDDKTIKKVALDYGCKTPFMRPRNISLDHSKIEQILLNIKPKIKSYCYIVILQPTSPLRLTVDIDETIKFHHDTKAKSTATVCEIQKPIEWIYNITNKRLKEIPNSSKKKKYLLNGSVYVVNQKNIMNNNKIINKETFAKLMPIERSIDIDTDFDFSIAEFLLKKRTYET